MDVSSAAFSPTRADVSKSLFSALGSSGRGHWNSTSSDSWNRPYLEGDPWTYPASDPEFCNASSPETVSPSSSVMGYSSPDSSMTVHSAALARLGEGSCPSPQAASSSSCEESGYPSSSSTSSGSSAQRSKRKTRSRNPSRQRQCASEKEKLRMRDLTKALHHLRTYLPPSVAPAGQTLTKIQTLRLAIRYIAHLSAQVETREESLTQSRGGQQSLYAPQVCLPQQQQQSERPARGQCWGAITQPSGDTDAKQAPWWRSMELPACQGPQDSPYDSTYEDLFNSSLDSLLESPAHTTEAKQSYQEYDKDMTFHTISPEYWI